MTEVVTLIDAARRSNRPDHAGVIYLAATTGARRGELCAIRRSHFNAEHQTLTIARSIVKKDGNKVDRPTKNRRIRSIAIDSKAASILQERMDTAATNSQTAGTTLADDPDIFADDLRGPNPAAPTPSPNTSGDYEPAWAWLT